MSDMTPEQARAELDSSLHTRTPEYVLARAESALRTIANMRVEHDHGVVDWETVDGRYETRHRVRLVSDWRDADPAEANAERARGCAVQAVIAAAKHQAAAHTAG